jgi:hypothetical protein
MDMTIGMQQTEKWWFNSSVQDMRMRRLINTARDGPGSVLKIKTDWNAQVLLASRLECTGTAGKQEYHLSRCCLLAMGAAGGWLKGMTELELKQNLSRFEAGRLTGTSGKENLFQCLQGIQHMCLCGTLT